MPGDFYARPLAYDDIARLQGEDAAQSLWLKNGGTGKYVPGMTAVAAWQDINGSVNVGKAEPHR